LTDAFHRAYSKINQPSPLKNTSNTSVVQGEYGEEASIKAWEAMMNRYADRWNVMSVDLR
jgi:hypothetical protein